MNSPLPPKMKMKPIYCYAILALTALIPSCAPMSNENAKPTAAIGAAVLGAAAGGIIGKQSDRAGEGAAIGAAAGGLYGWENGSNILGGDGSVQGVRRGN